jgi:hypothetical protein
VGSEDAGQKTEDGRPQGLCHSCDGRNPALSAMLNARSR